MSGMDGREKAFEDKFAHDEQLEFKARARRNKLFGLVVAEELGKTGDEATKYAGEVIVADLEEEGDDDIFRKVEKDLEAAGIEISRHRMEKRLDELMVTARQQVWEETQ